MKLYHLSLDEWETLDPFGKDDMITTIDNPYDPKEDFSKWYQWDIENGYNTSEYVARLAGYDANDDEYQTMLKYHRAMMEAITYNENKYKIV